MRPVHRFLAAAMLSASLWLPGMAEAADAPPAVQAFLTNIERQTKLKPAYDSLDVDGSGNVTIKNLTMAQAASGDALGFNVKAAEVQFSGITEEAPSLYAVGKASFNNVTLDVTTKDGPVTATLPEASAEGWYIRALGENPTAVEQLLATSSFARKMNTGKISFSASGQTVSVDGAESTWDGDPKTGAGTFNMKINNIAIPEAVLTLMDPTGMMKQLGYSSLNLDVATSGDTKIEGDKVGYSFKLGLTGRDIASISLGAGLADIPLAVYTAILKAQSEGKEPDLTALMPQMQAILLNNASIRFEDASLVNKLMPMIAAMQGMDEKTLRASIAPMLQLTLVQLQNEAFAKQATEAVTAFLASPKSITLSAQPTAPLSFAEFQSMDPNKPGDAITKLGLSVKAND